MAITANTITDAAYRKIGIIAPTAVEDANALEALNSMISLWGTEFITPSIVEQSHALTVGTEKYAIGSGATIDAERPLSIINAFIRDTTDTTDTPLKILTAKEYNAVTDKSESGTPNGLYYYASYPAGMIYLDKAPDAIDTLYLEYWGNFTEFALLTTTITLPLEYKKALVYNLAIELAEDNGISLVPSVYRAAELSRVLISRIVSANRLSSGSEYPIGTGGILIAPPVGNTPRT